MDINLRLAKLERENRRMKKIGVIAIVVVSTFIIGGQSKTNKVVEANEFRLVDASGKVRAELKMVSGEPVSGELLNHAAIGVWYKPRQCFCHR